MIIQAELKRKQSEYKGEACAVDKVRLIHATKSETIQRLLNELHLTPYQVGRVNNLRKLCELPQIEC